MRPVVVEAHFPLGAVSVPLAGGAHVVVFVVNHPRGPAGFQGHQCRHHRGNSALRFLAAEAAPHPLADANDLVHVQAQRLGHDVLRFGRILRRGMDDDLSFLARIGERRLRFEIKLLLAQIVEHAGEPMRGRLQCGLRIAAADLSRRADEFLQLDGALDRQNRFGRRDVEFSPAAAPFPKPRAIRQR